MLTASGRRWKQENWKKFRQRFRPRLDAFRNWLAEQQDYEEEIFPQAPSNPSIIYKNMKAAEVVLEAEKAYEIQRLVACMTGNRGRPRKQLPKKSNSKPPFGRFVSGSNDPSTKPVSEDYVF